MTTNYGDSYWPAPREHLWRELGIHTALFVGAILYCVWKFEQETTAWDRWLPVVLPVAILPAWTLRVAAMFRTVGVHLSPAGIELRKTIGNESTPWNNIKFVEFGESIEHPDILVVYCASSDVVRRSLLVRARLRFLPLPGPGVIWVRPTEVADRARLETAMRTRLGLGSATFEEVFPEEPFKPDDWFPAELKAKRRRTGYSITEVDTYLGLLEHKLRHLTEHVTAADFEVSFPQVSFTKSYDIEWVDLYLELIREELNLDEEVGGQ